MPNPTLFDLSGKVALVVGAGDPLGQAIVAQLAAQGATVASSDADRSSQAACEALVADAIAQHGQVDVLVCNGAATQAEEPNLLANHWLAAKACADMASRRDGAVVLVGSTAGLAGSPEAGARSLAHAADVQLARNLAVEWGRHNIRANCVAPALIEAETPALSEEQQERRGWTYPLQRAGSPQDVAGVVVALAAQAGAWMSGQTVVVDGGMMAGSGREEG